MLTTDDLRPLPPTAAELLTALDAPPRLTAHLLLVHDVAASLVTWLGRHCPGLPVDGPAVLFGAATHDIGKTVHVEELSSPGREHEAAGHQLLLQFGVPPELARFADTHGSWTAEGIGLEDLLVSTADHVWKGERVPELDHLVGERLAEFTAGPQWDLFLTHLADGGEARLAFQNSHPVR